VRMSLQSRDTVFYCDVSDVFFVCLEASTTKQNGDFLSLLRSRERGKRSTVASVC
jgi:hypothetical protein